MSRELSEDGSRRQPEDVEDDQASQNEQIVEGEEEWKVSRIIGENRKSKKYRVEWEGVDSQTGKPYEPTWVRSSLKAAAAAVSG